MYRIIKADDGAVIGSTEAPRFIKKSSAGCFVQTDEANAQGVAFKGTPYNLRDREGVDAEETVIVIEFDGAEVTADTADKVVEIEDAMCEQDTAVEERLAAIEDALCELDKN